MDLEKSSEALPSSLYERYVKQEEEKWNGIMSMDGTENAYVLHKELGEWMTDNVTVVRYNDKLLKTDEKIQELLERYKILISMIQQNGATKEPRLLVNLRT